MSTTLTRRQVIAMGERAAIKAAKRLGRKGRKIGNETPEVIAFHQALSLGAAFAVGGGEREGALCPMRQTVFDPNSNEVATQLAYAWDDEVFATLHAIVPVVSVNPRS